ncbi:MAG: hypothetical protein K2K98_12710 [Muribaculaceae bacterium]|nr:hypothetical protein [Muribaculaceae bacterium]
MKRTILTLLILIGLGMLPSGAFGQKTKKEFIDAIKEHSQKPGKTGKKQNKTDGVTLAMLKSATKITYGFGNGTVLPEYAYQGYIIVTPKSVTLEIYNNSRVCFSDTERLSTTQYATFLNRLYGLGLKPNPNDPMMLCGGTPDSIEIMKGNQTLFKGDINENIVTTNGYLYEPFKTLLPDYMKDVYEDPGSTFEPRPFDPDNIYDVLP